MIWNHNPGILLNVKGYVGKVYGLEQSRALKSLDRRKTEE